MTDTPQSIVVTRAAQVFPALSDADMDRIRRFGTLRTYAAGDPVAVVGQAGLGMILILSGEVEITQQGNGGEQSHIVTHRRGSFMGELAQLWADRPWSMPMPSPTSKPSLFRRIASARC